jgi:hypothetical protein
VIYDLLHHIYAVLINNTMEIKYPILLIALLAITQCSQDVAIQSQGYGFSVGDPYGTLHIQFFLDFQCIEYIYHRF